MSWQFYPPTMMSSVHGVEEGENNISNIFKLEHISSTKEKEAVLSQLTPAEFLIFELIFDPFRKYNVTSKLIDKDAKKVRTRKFDVSKQYTIHVDQLFDLTCMLTSLENRHVTGNAAVEKVKEFYDKRPDYIKKLVICILDKDFAGGVGLKLINKSLPKGHKRIAHFEPMLCDTINKSDGTLDFKKVSFPCYGETKMDGVRVLYMKRNGVIKCLARSGKEYVNFLVINEQVEKLLENVDNMFLDGEIHGATFDDIMEVAKAKEPTTSTEFIYTIWDFAPVSIYDGQSDNTPLEKRYEHLNELFALVPVDISLEFKNLSIIQPKVINNQVEAIEFLKSMNDAGEEGVIFKNPKGLYRTKRHKDWVKGKLFLEDSFVIVGVTEHSKKFDTLGALVCKMDDSEETFKVGSGFTDDQRDKLWRDKDNLVGMEVDVRFKKRSKNTLQFPTFIKLRTDRD